MTATDKVKAVFAKGWRPLTHVTFVKNDWNGFVQLFFDNCSTVLLLINLLLTAVWVPPTLSEATTPEFRQQVSSLVGEKANQMVWGTVVPGLAIAMVFGNLYYSWMACRLSYAESRFRDVSSLPYGVNTPAAFGFIFSILMPAYRSASSGCVELLNNSTTPEDYADCLSGAIDSTWKTGVVSNLLAGLFGIGIGIMGKLIAKVTPEPALLASLATIGISFLLMSSLGNAFRDPIAGVTPFLLMIIGYLSGVSFSPIPTALAIMVAGAILGWADGSTTPEAVTSAAEYVKWTGVGTGVQAFGYWDNISDYVGVILPLAIQASVGTLMNVQSAKTVGDSYPIRESMIADGVGCVVGAFFGTPFMTSVYIGHPSYKAIGATMGYSIVNSAFFFIVSISGLFALVNAIIPSAAITPVIAFVGIVICKEAAESVDKRHFVVFLLGLVPGMCDWGIQGGLSYSGLQANFFGIYALSRSSIFFSMIICSILYFTIDRDYIKASAWSFFAAACASVGLIHQQTVSVNAYAYPVGGYCVSKQDLLGMGSEDEACPTDFVPCEGTSTTLCGYRFATRWSFAVNYIMFAGVFFILWLFQRYTSRVPPTLTMYPEQDEEKSTQDETDSVSEKTDRTRHGPHDAEEGTTFHNHLNDYDANMDDHKTVPV